MLWRSPWALPPGCHRQGQPLLTRGTGNLNSLSSQGTGTLRLSPGGFSSKVAGFKAASPSRDSCWSGLGLEALSRGLLLQGFRGPGPSPHRGFSGHRPRALHGAVLRVECTAVH